MTNQEIINAAVSAHAALDAALQEARVASLALEASTEAGAAAGLAKPLVCKEMIQKTRTLTGAIASAALLSADLHQDGTKIAKANNLDTGTLTSAGGVVIMSGGDR